MKPGPVTTIHKRKKKMSKKIDSDVKSENCDAIIIFPIYDKFGAIQKLNSGNIVFKTYVFINSNLISYKN